MRTARALAIGSILLLLSCSRGPKAPTAESPLANQGAEEEGLIIKSLVFAGDFRTQADGDKLWVNAQLSVLNYSEAQVTPQQLVVFEPSDASGLMLEGDERFVGSESGIAISGALAAKEQVNVVITFSVPLGKGAAALEWKLPLGSVKTSLIVEGWSGVEVESKPAAAEERTLTANEGQPFRVLELPMIARAGTVEISVRGLPYVADSDCSALAPSLANPSYGLVPADGSRPSPQAYDFAADDRRGNNVRLSDFQRTEKTAGKVVLVHFWATWCAPCRTELPDLAAMKATLGDDVVVLALSADQTWPSIELFSPPKQLTVLHDPAPSETVLGPVAVRYGTKAVPETYVVDRDGRLRYYFINKRDWSQPEAAACIKSLL